MSLVDQASHQDQAYFIHIHSYRSLEVQLPLQSHGQIVRVAVISARDGPIEEHLYDRVDFLTPRGQWCSNHRSVQAGSVLQVHCPSVTH